MKHHPACYRLAGKSILQRDVFASLQQEANRLTWKPQVKTARLSNRVTVIVTGLPWAPYLARLPVSRRYDSQNLATTFSRDAVSVMFNTDNLRSRSVMWQTDTSLIWQIDSTRRFFAKKVHVLHAACQTFYASFMPAFDWTLSNLLLSIFTRWD